MDQSRSTPNGNLEQAFHIFNDVCRQLESSYRILENRVAHGNGDLGIELGDFMGEHADATVSHSSMRSWPRPAVNASSSLPKKSAWPIV